MAKFKISPENLPPPDSDGDHIFRFRITSEDKTRVSEYSNLYVLKSEGKTYPLRISKGGNVFGESRILASTSKSGSGQVITALWETPTQFYTGASAQLDAKTRRDFSLGLIVGQSSSVDLNVSGIVPNIYKHSDIGLNVYVYKFFDKVTRADVANVKSKILALPNVLYVTEDEPISLVNPIELGNTAKFGTNEVDIFVQFASASVSNNAFTYIGTTKESQTSIIANASATYIRIIGQISHYPKEIDSKYQFFDTGSVSISNPLPF